MALTSSMCLRKTKSFLRFWDVKSHLQSLTQISKTLSHRNCNSVALKGTIFYSRFNKNGFVIDTRPHTHLSNYVMRCRSCCPALLTFANTRMYTAKKSNESITQDLLQSKIGRDHQKSSEQNDKNGTGGKSNKKERSESSWLHPKHAWKLGLLSLVGMGVLMSGNLIIMWGAPLRDNEGNQIEDEFSSLPSWQAYTKRAFQEARFFKKMIEEPSYKKLLPDPLKEPWYQPPYTLVIELTGVLVHPDWTLGTGWRFKKRPAVSYFLQQVASPLFEVVIFTKEQGFTAFPLIDSLDPNGHVTFRLFRDATRYMNGSHVKDLDNLNRDLSKVILVDCEPKAFQKHPRNALLLKKWTGEDSDRMLIDLAQFLRTISMSNVDDVRPVLEHYSQYDDPLEAFKENQRRLQQQGDQERGSQPADQQDKQSLMGFGKSLLRRR